MWKIQSFVQSARRVQYPLVQCYRLVLVLQLTPACPVQKQWTLISQVRRNHKPSVGSAFQGELFIPGIQHHGDHGDGHLAECCLFFFPTNSSASARVGKTSTCSRHTGANYAINTSHPVLSTQLPCSFSVSSFSICLFSMTRAPKLIFRRPSRSPSSLPSALQSTMSLAAAIAFSRSFGASLS